MPELAEVETLKSYLKNNLLNQKVISLKKNRDKLRYIINPRLGELSIGGKILEITRRAKFLNIKFDNGNTLVVHLGMSGRLTIESPVYQVKKHDHLLIFLSNGNCLVFNDPRRFGMIYICITDQLAQQSFYKNMGIEPLTNKFNYKYLKDKLKDKRTAIKTAIMDNKIVVGVGNIYVAESLFKSKIHPNSIAKNVNTEKLHNLVYSIKYILTKAIEAGGTTLKDFVNGDNKPGYFKQELKVYDREGKNCYICGNLIEKIKQSGRSSFFCPKCQS